MSQAKTHRPPCAASLLFSKSVYALSPVGGEGNGASQIDCCGDERDCAGLSDAKSLPFLRLDSTG